MKSQGDQVLVRISLALLLTLAPGSVVLADYPSTVLSQGPVGYWRLNESAPPPPPQPAANLGSLGTTGNGNYLYDATPGEPGAFAGVTNTSVRFLNPAQDVTYGGSKIEVPYNVDLNPNGPFTVEFWAKPHFKVSEAFCMVASLDSDPSLALPPDSNPRAGWLFYQRFDTNTSANVWQFKLGNGNNYLDGDALVGGTVSTGAWHHIVGVYNGSSATLYVNGVQVASRPIAGFQPNRARPFRIGTTCFDGSLGTLGAYTGNRGFDGWLEEVAFYGAALTSQTIAAHYATAQTNAAGYASAIRNDHPNAYWRLGEPGNPVALNLGSLGTNANAHYVYAASPGRAGPRPPGYVGLDANNKACAFQGTNGYVGLPALNLNTNTVTITAWVLANAIQTNNAGIVFCRSGTTVAGLKFDLNDPNGLSYNWNNDSAAANFKSSLSVPVGHWAFVAMIVQPDQAVLCLNDPTAANPFQAVTNYAVHPEQSFAGLTTIGTDVQDGSLTFNGRIDEVAIFNRALSVGEVYVQYAAAVGGLEPTVFSAPQAPDSLYLGETLTLTVDAGGTPPLGFQWRTNGIPIPGATAPSFSKTNIAAGDAAAYDVIVTNAYGSVISAAASISVQPLTQPTISQDPQGRVLYASGLLSLTVQASGGDLAFQWQKNGTNVAGATNASYVVPHASSSDAGTYQVSISNPLGTARSAPAILAVLVPPPNSFEATILGDSPESWWRLNDPVGTAILTDALGRHDGVFKGGVTLGVPSGLTGSSNTAASFNGSSGYAEVPYTKDLNTSTYTVECWVRANPTPKAICPVSSFTQPPGRGYLLQSWNGQWNYFSGDGVNSYVLYIPGSDAIYSKWTYLAATYDGTNFIGYLNGRFDSGVNTVTGANNVAPFRIGLDQPSTGWSDYWDGDIADVAFYPRALSESQIAAHYSAALYGPNSEPIFIQQPQPLTVIAGHGIFFSSIVEGTQPITLQWQKNGVPVLDETNRFLVINNATFSDTAVYTLVATNPAGYATSVPATLTVAPEPTFANVTNSLVLHLKLDGTYGDASGRGNNAQPVGSPKFIPGIIGSNAVHVSTVVDQSDPQNLVVTDTNYVTLGTPPDLQFGSNVNFSVSYWVRFTGVPGDLPFLCNSLNSFSNPGFTFAPSYSLGGWSYSLGDVTTLNYVGIYGPDASLNDGAWHHLAHTFDRSGSGITYLDGVDVDSRSVAAAGNLDTGEVINVGQDASGAYPEAGAIDIDDVGAWRRVLTPYEVALIYNAGLAGRSFDSYGPVTLAVRPGVGFIQLIWEAGTLLEADDLNGPWSSVPGAKAPYFTPAPSAAKKFYRVQL